MNKEELVDEEVIADEANQFLHLDNAPGRIHEIALNVMEFMRYPRYEIAVEGALHIVNVFAGNYFNYDGIPCHRKTILLAGQGIGKNVIRNYFESACNELIYAKGRMNPLFKDFIGAGSYGSIKNMHVELQNFGSRSMISSEAGHMRSSTSADRSGLKGYENQILASQPNAVHFPKKQNTQKGELDLKHLHSVCISMIHESVAMSYIRLMNEGSQFQDGTVSRCSVLFINSNIDAGEKNKDSTRATVKPAIIDLFFDIAWQLIGRGDVEHRGYELPRQKFIDADVKATHLFDNLEDDYIKERNNAKSYVHEGIYTRKIIRIKQTARLMAIAENPDKPFITFEMAEWAKYRTDQIDATINYHADKGLLSSGMVRLTTRFIAWCKTYLKGSSTTSLEKEKNSIPGTYFRSSFIGNNMDNIRQLKAENAYKHKDDAFIVARFTNHLVDSGYIRLYNRKRLTGVRYGAGAKHKDMQLMFDV